MTNTSENDVRQSPEREQWNARYEAKELVWTAKANRFLVEEIQTLSPGKALDLAAGEARNAVWLAEQDWQVEAVDFSEVAADKGRQLASQRGVADKLTFTVADLRDFVPEEGGYDLVVVFYLHLPAGELAPVLNRAAKAVAPGGTFLLVGHDLDNLERGYGGPQSPAVLYTAEDVVAALGGVLTIDKAERVERPVETDTGPRIALDCLVRGRRV